MITSLSKFKTLFGSFLATSMVIAQLAFGSDSCCLSGPLLEFKTGYFFFSDSTMQRVYDKGGIDVQLAASYPFMHFANGWILNAYGAVEYFHCSGRSLNGNQKTSISGVPFSIGLKSEYSINAVTKYYLSLGPRCLYIHQHNHSNYVYKSRSKSDLGFFVNTGLNYSLCSRWVANIFGEYSYVKMRVHGGASNITTRNVQVGGYTFGGGIGYEF